MTGSCRPSLPVSPCWGIALGPQWVDAVPVESHDTPVDGVVFGDRISP